MEVLRLTCQAAAKAITSPEPAAVQLCGLAETGWQLVGW